MFIVAENPFHATEKLELLQLNRHMPFLAENTDSGATVGIKDDAIAQQIYLIFKELQKC